MGYPTTGAAYEILRSCILELSRCNMLTLPSSYTSTNTEETEAETRQTNSSQTSEVQAAIDTDNIESSSVVDYYEVQDIYNPAFSSDLEDVVIKRRPPVQPRQSASHHRSRNDSSGEEAVFVHTLPAKQKIELLVPPFSQASLNLFSKPQAYSSRLCALAKDCNVLSPPKKKVLKKKKNFCARQKKEITNIFILIPHRVLVDANCGR